MKLSKSDYINNRLFIIQKMKKLHNNDTTKNRKFASIIKLGQKLVLDT